MRSGERTADQMHSHVVINVPVDAYLRNWEIYHRELTPPLTLRPSSRYREGMLREQSNNETPGKSNLTHTRTRPTVWLTRRSRTVRPLRKQTHSSSQYCVPGIILYCCHGDVCYSLTVPASTFSSNALLGHSCRTVGIFPAGSVTTSYCQSGFRSSSKTCAQY